MCRTACPNFVLLIVGLLFLSNACLLRTIAANPSTGTRGPFSLKQHKISDDTISVKSERSLNVFVGNKKLTIHATLQHVTSRNPYNGAIHIAFEGNAQPLIRWRSLEGNSFMGFAMPSPSMLRPGHYELSISDKPVDTFLILDCAEMKYQKIKALYGDSVQIERKDGLRGSIEQPENTDYAKSRHKSVENEAMKADKSNTEADAALSMVAEKSNLQIEVTDQASWRAFRKCNGKITLKASGGKSPYRFILQDSSGYIQQGNRPDELCRGFYQITVKDAGDFRATKTVFLPATSGQTFPQIRGAATVFTNQEETYRVKAGNVQWHISGNGTLMRKTATHAVVRWHGNGMITATAGQKASSMRVVTYKSAGNRVSRYTLTPGKDTLDIAKGGKHYNLIVYDMSNRPIVKKHNYKNDWRGCDSDGNPLAEGRYWAKLHNQQNGNGKEVLVLIQHDYH